jgi:hypothetical protein
VAQGDELRPDEAVEPLLADEAEGWLARANAIDATEDNRARRDPVQKNFTAPDRSILPTRDGFI